MSTFLDAFLTETSTSALPVEVKRLAAYLTVAHYGQQQLRRFEYENPSGERLPLRHSKILSLSCILTGKPGSYKSETVRLVRRIIEATEEVTVYPHDQVTREYIITTLRDIQLELAKRLNPTLLDEKTGHIRPFNAENLPPISCVIYIEELVNFLNRRDYVEPLVGTLNTLLDQPDSYGAGTQRRQSEILFRPLVALFGACAPAWFTQLPESLFTGGWAGRSMFYYVPYPKDEDRQPRGQACQDGGEKRLASFLKSNLPPGNLVLRHSTLQVHDRMEREWGREDAHPVPVLDEWYKRRTIQTTRLSGAIALAQGHEFVEIQHWDEANDILDKVANTLTNIWFTMEASPPVQHLALQLRLSKLGEVVLPELERICIENIRSIPGAHRLIDWWVHTGILLEMPSGKFALSNESKAQLAAYELPEDNNNR